MARRNEKLYHVYHGIKQRCYNKNNPKYDLYGGKGVKMCNEWYDDYLVFKQWSLENGYKPNQNLSIDRIDGEKGYEKGNVRFIPLEENLRNKACVKTVRLENVITGEIIIEPSLGRASVRLFGDTKHASAISRTIKRNGVYLNTWKITYLD